MKEIPLTKGKIALVDDEDYDKLSRFSWQAMLARRNWYAATCAGPNRSRLMHRIILGLSDKAVQVDHRDGNGLNNQRRNLRLCTARQNPHNSKKRIDGIASKYKGVSKSKNGRKWCASIRISKKRRRLGAFDNEIDAAKAYDAAAKSLFGDFAYLNFPENAPAKEGGKP